MCSSSTCERSTGYELNTTSDHTPDSPFHSRPSIFSSLRLRSLNPSYLEQRQRCSYERLGEGADWARKTGSDKFFQEEGAKRCDRQKHEKLDNRCGFIRWTGR